MNTSLKCCGSARDIGLLALRIGVGVIFTMHGYGKLFGDAPGMDAFTGMITGLGFPLPALLAYAAALTEFVGGIAILLGIFTSVATVLGAIVMLVALFMVKKFNFPASDIDLMLLASLVTIFCLGAGRYSLAAAFNMKGANGCCGDAGCCDTAGAAKKA
jgi:putative oxidoreductase